MENKLFDQLSEREDEIRSLIRDKVLAEIKRRSMSYEQLAQELGLLPTGARVLLEQSYWSVERGLRVAIALGLKINVEITNE